MKRKDGYYLYVNKVFRFYSVVTVVAWKIYLLQFFLKTSILLISALILRYYLLLKRETYFCDFYSSLIEAFLYRNKVGPLYLWD
jgi:hypothetical protein